MDAAFKDNWGDQLTEDKVLCSPALPAGTRANSLIPEGEAQSAATVMRPAPPLPALLLNANCLVLGVTDKAGQGAQGNSLFGASMAVEGWQ